MSSDPAGCGQPSRASLAVPGPGGRGSGRRRPGPWATLTLFVVGAAITAWVLTTALGGDTLAAELIVAATGVGYAVLILARARSQAGHRDTKAG
jgi:hypothetical protein